MHLDKFVVSVIVFFVVVIAGVMVATDINNNYDDVNMNIDQYVNGTYITATGDDSFDNAEDMEAHILGGEVDDEDTADSMFSGGYSATRLISTPVSLTNDVLNQIASEIGIPQVFIRYALVALSVMITFAIIFLIFRIKA